MDEAVMAETLDSVPGELVRSIQFGVEHAPNDGARPAGR
jgi:hypothetical protein